MRRLASGVQSGDIGDNQSTWIETTVEGPGTLRSYAHHTVCDRSPVLPFTANHQSSIILHPSQGSIIAEYDGDDELLHKYVHGPGVDQPICMIDVNDANAVYYYHFDGLGSVIALTDSSGDAAVLYEYSVYGQPAASDPNHPNRFMFTGREFDAETGLYYYRARYYNPYIGRFLQTDPIGYADGVNSYAYCANDPTNCADPSGCSACGPIFHRDETDPLKRWTRPTGYPPHPRRYYWHTVDQEGKVTLIERHWLAGPYFIQSWNMSCAAVAILNTWLSIGRPLPGNAVASDLAAEAYVCKMLEGVHITDSLDVERWDRHGIWTLGGMERITQVLGWHDTHHWITRTDRLENAGQVTSAIRESGKPVIVAVNLGYALAPALHCITIAKTPQSLVNYLKREYGGVNADYEWSILDSYHPDPWWMSEGELNFYITTHQFAEQWVAGIGP